jgi:hypothetical protein
MSSVDTIVPLLRTRWNCSAGEPTPIVPLPALQPETIRHLETHWPGFMTVEMRDLLQLSCGLSATPLGNIDFTGRWYAEESLSIFRPSLTLAIDEKGRRWIAEIGKTRGLPGPVWCIAPSPGVALFIDRTLGEFLLRLHDNVRRNATPEWLATLTIRARALWARRYARAMAVPVALGRLKEIRGWLARLPPDAWIYDLRTPAIPRGLPYGLASEPGHLCRCGRLPVFALLSGEVQAATSEAYEGAIISQTQALAH